MTAFDVAAWEREQWSAPKWDEENRVHNWRNYISAKVRALWPSFTDEQKAALYEQADEQASQENWE